MLKEISDLYESVRVTRLRIVNLQTSLINNANAAETSRHMDALLHLYAAALLVCGDAFHSAMTEHLDGTPSSDPPAMIRHDS